MTATGTEKTARTFARLGWAGFYIQLALMVLPVFMLCYLIFGKATGTRETLDFTEYLAIFSLMILAFTTFWSYRYTRLAKWMDDPHRRPPRDSIVNTLWVGLWASGLGIAVSMLSLFIEVIRLLVLFLQAPQGGVPVFQTQPDNRTAWVSAIDAVSLLAELCTLAGELVVLGFTLWLLFKITQFAGDYDEAGEPIGEGSRSVTASSTTHV
jgi:hypothetical protein